MNMQLWERQTRRHMRSVGWVLIIYYAIMNLLVSVCQLYDVLLLLAKDRMSFNLDSLLDATASDGWGYAAAIATGMVVLLGWKGTNFWRQQICAKGKPMRAQTFLAIMCVFLGAQLVGSTITTFLDTVLGLFGMRASAVYEAVLQENDSVSMVLYTALLAPVSEEILFRGVIQRSMLPYGRRFAIFCSAFCFGMFHGNLVQAPFAFLVGLVLGYVASEYALIWCILLHIINNFVMGELLTRVLNLLPEMAAALLENSILLGAAAAGAWILWKRRDKIRLWWYQNQTFPGFYKCFFTNSGTIAMLVVFGFSMIYALLMFR